MTDTDSDDKLPKVKTKRSGSEISQVLTDFKAVRKDGLFKGNETTSRPTSTTLRYLSIPNMSFSSNKTPSHNFLIIYMVLQTIGGLSGLR